MRIAVVTGIFPPDIGGPATYVPAISKSLTQSGHDIHVVCLSDSTREADEFQYPVTRVKRKAFKPWRYLRTILAILYASRGADVVYLNGLFIEGMLAASVRRLPTVVKIVGDQSWERARNRGWFAGTIDEYQVGPKPAFCRVLDFARALPVRLASRVIVPSAYLKRIVVGWGVEKDKVEVVYNSVPPQAPWTPKRELMASRLRILTVCRLVPWKGVDRLIEVIADSPGMTLTVCGDGPCANDLRDLSIRLGVSERVHFHGTMPHSEILNQMKQADIFVLNSTYEGLPHVVLEAMAAGLPVVATDAGGTGELVIDGVTGCLISTGDSVALRESLTKLATSEEYRLRLAQGARELLKAQFSYGNMIDATMQWVISTARKR